MNGDKSAPSDLKSLLNFSIRATGEGSDEPKDSENAERHGIDSERAEWLRQVLANLTVDIPEELRKNLADLCAENASESDQVEALDAILDIVDDLNYATDFFKVGGFRVLLRYLRESDSPPVRAKCGEVIAELVQNHEWAQKEALSHNGLEVLVAAFLEDNDVNVKTTTFSAIARLVRDSEELVRHFGAQHADVVATALEPSAPLKLKTKASFFLNHILVLVPEVVKCFSACVDKLAMAFGTDSVTNAFVLGALRLLWTLEVAEQQKDFIFKVSQRKNEIESDDQYLDEFNQAQSFLKRVHVVEMG